MTDFFISYTRTDEAWAEWTAWTLEAEGFTVTVQKWDFRPGANFVLAMQSAATASNRTIAILSPDYLRSAYAAPEWAAAFAPDPQGLQAKLVPVRVAECDPEGLLKATVYIDLVDRDETEARQALLDGVAERRAKPTSKPHFPGKGAAPPFPGRRRPADPPATLVSRYMPKLRGRPSDLEKRRFFRDAFEVIQSEFRQRLTQIQRENAGVESELTRIDATKFTAEIFVHGKSRARCKIWQGGLHNSDGISFAEGTTAVSDGATNEILTLADNGELALRALMNMGFGRTDQGLDVQYLSPEEAAEYLWRRFTWHLES